MYYFQNETKIQSQLLVHFHLTNFKGLCADRCSNFDISLLRKCLYCNIVLMILTLCFSLYITYPNFKLFMLMILRLSKGTKIRNRYNQVPHLTQDTKGKVTNLQLDTTNESQEEVSPFPAGDHKAHTNRRSQRHSKHKTEKTIKDSQKKYRL